jgi:hypothetical protein
MHVLNQDGSNGPMTNTKNNPLEHVSSLSLAAIKVFQSKHYSGHSAFKIQFSGKPPCANFSKVQLTMHCAVG